MMRLFPLRPLLLTLFMVSFMALVFAPAMAQNKAAKVDAKAADPQDPFVRGLQRLDEKLRMQREAEALARSALELEQRKAREANGETNGESVPGDKLEMPAPLSDPDFFTAYAASQYRLDGLVLSRPAQEPVIHIYEEKVKPSLSVLYWSGDDRRWVYERVGDEKLSAIAKKLWMKPADILAMNGVAREAQLSDPKRFYVSPRDNGPLTHIIRRGDTLAKLAAAYDTDAPRLKVRNNLDAEARLIIGKRFLVREKAIDDRLSRLAVPQPPKLDLSSLEKARRPYARLGQYATKASALRGAREFYLKYYEFMDSDILLRMERDPDQKEQVFYNMDLGPLRSMRHGEAFCGLFRKDELPCLVVARVPGPERVQNFDSQAIISVSPYVFFDGDELIETGSTDVDKVTKLEYFLTEGQELGNAEGTIAKITAKRIMLTDANGYLLTLPLHKIPEIDPIEKRKQEEAAKQAQRDQAAAVAAAAVGGIEAPDAPSLEDSGLAQNLKNNEATRRGGSDSFIKNLAEKPKKIEK
jgi:nucleoid-associated protein YgaU